MTEEVTREQAQEALTLWERVALFRKEMSLKEVRLLRKCQEDPNDVQGVLAGVLWIARARNDKSATFDAVMDLTEDALLAELAEVLPKAEGTLNLKS